MTTHRPEIDGLRAFAVLAVIIFHFSETLLPSGFLGVDIFFVISGYVITRSLRNRTDEPFSKIISSFYARRVKRLLPALVVCVAVTSAAALVVNWEPKVSLVTGALSLLGLSNIYLFNQAEDYFAAATAYNHFTHTWSLGVEEQFYLLFPLLLFSVRVRRAQVIALTIASVASLVAFIHFNSTWPAAAFYLSPMRFWELGAGCLLALVPLRLPAPFVPLAILAVTLAIPPKVSEIFPPGTTIAVVFASVWLIAAINQASPVRKFLSSAPMLYVGKRSYSLYLWHWSVISIARWLVEITLLNSIVLLALIFVLAAASYKFIEQPIRQSTWPSRQILLAGGMTAATLAAASTAVAALIPPPPLLDEWKFGYMQATMPCHMPKDQNPLAACLTRKSDRRTIFLIGDSHASNLVPSVEAAAEDKFDVRYLADRDIKEAGLISKAEFLSGQIRSGDIVIYSIWRSRLYAGPFKGISRQAEAIPAWAEDIRRGLTVLNEKVRTAGGALVLVGDVPQICDPSDLQIKVANGKAKECATDAKISYADQAPLLDIYRSIGVEILDPHSSLCRGGRCTMYLNGKQLYGDGAGHFPATNPAPLADFFKAWIATL